MISTKEEIGPVPKLVSPALHYYDLDGTLSSLNSTFDFIYGYLKNKRKYVRLFLGKSIALFLILTKTYHPVKSRSLLINIYFWNLKTDTLEEYFENVYKPIFLKSLTSLGRSLLNETDKADVMLTGCTEIPAKKIASLFGFKEVISTEFYYNNGKIKGIKTDTYGNFKVKHLLKRKERMIYYTDDLRSEKSLISIMDEIVEV
jgi:hypothetical protein